MFELLFTSQLSIHRPRTAPLRTEREQFLEELRRQGSSHANLLQSASRLVDVVQFVNLRNLRPVTFDEIMDAGKVWVKKREPQRVRSFQVAIRFARHPRATGGRRQWIFIRRRAVGRILKGL